MGPDGSVDLVEEGRLRSFFLQLRTESGILDRMIYKNKNQHRRCSYFQSLLKVRRDVRLLLSVGLEEILNSAFQVIHGKNPSQRLYLLERLKERHSGGKHNFQERLLGVTRLLSQMVEPILRAAIQISSLLARTFFMAFSLTILSLLARLRVLVQQMLVDTVSVFNRVTSVSQKRHTVKLTKNGVEAFREYYPPSWDVISLDCSWQGDKFVLLEGTQVSMRKEIDEDLGVVSLEGSDIQYETLEASIEGDVLKFLCRKLLETELSLGVNSAYVSMFCYRCILYVW
uniref:Uncharacterized protein yceH n=1 Tax=Anthurium amnicola TaxID=1678845 RepID=A0A1D1ZHZ3_9ARAE